MWCKQGTIPNQEMTDMRTKKFEKKRKKEKRKAKREKFRCCRNAKTYFML